MKFSPQLLTVITVLPLFHPLENHQAGEKKGIHLIMLLIWYHISVLAGPDVKNAAKNNGGDKREVSRQKRILVIILWLLWSSIDAYDDRAQR